jgi:Predicted transcription regulator containing HTH domain
MELYKVIGKHMNDNGIKQSFVAQETGLTQDRVSSVLNGKRKLSADEFVLICRKAFKVNPSIFFDKSVLESKE